ncbi:hypothetical protein D3C74_369660 [compost metagenome]
MEAAGQRTGENVFRGQDFDGIHCPCVLLGSHIDKANVFGQIDVPAKAIQAGDHLTVFQSPKERGQFSFVPQLEQADFFPVNGPGVQFCERDRCFGWFAERDRFQRFPVFR